MLYWLTKIVLYIICKILFRHEVTGIENLPKHGAFIVASNHRSHLDPPIVCISIGRKSRFMAKAELFGSRLGNFYFTGVNCIRVERGGVDRSALKEGLVTLKKGGVIAIFPEGTRSKNGRLGPAKAGAALFAFNTGVPVIPMFIDGTDRALAPGRSFISIAKTKAKFGKRLYAPKIAEGSNKRQAYQNFADRIMEEIANLERGKA